MKTESCPKNFTGIFDTDETTLSRAFQSEVKVRFHTPKDAGQDVLKLKKEQREETFK